jgi:hypothetical protein
MYLMAQLWVYLVFACVLGILIGVSARKLYRVVRLQHTLEAVEFRHTEQMAGISAEHEAALASLEELRHQLNRSLEQGGEGSSGDLHTRIGLREQQLKDLGNQLRRVNQELVRTEAARQQVALERKKAGDEIETLRSQVVASRARLAQAVSAHDQEKAALVRQLVALMPAASMSGDSKGTPIGLATGVMTGSGSAAAPASAVPTGAGTFSAAASLAESPLGAGAPTRQPVMASAIAASTAPAAPPANGHASVETGSAMTAATLAEPAGDATMQAAVQAGIAAAMAAMDPVRELQQPGA